MRNPFRKKPVDAAPADEEATFGAALVNGYELRAPSHQTAVDLIAGWSMAFPKEYGITAGNLPFHRDSRVGWAIEQHGPVEGRSVMELGPLEGGHTALLEKHGAIVDAVESSGAAYVKCLITKEIMGLRNARFHLGDANLWLEERETRYDLIVASGVLYHMTDPVRLLRLMAARTDAIFIWTMVVIDDSIAPTRVEPCLGVDVRLYAVPYGARTKSFCGGAKPEAMWMHRNDLVAVLGAMGFSKVLLNHEQVGTYGPSCSIYAARAG